MASLDVAIRLVTQAVHQDTSKNYEEAARCYRDAVVVFKTVARSGHVSKKVRKAIEAKCSLYEDRLRKLDRHLLSKADLSKLFRECVTHELRDRSKSSNSLSSGENSTEGSVNSEDLCENPFLKRGLETIARAKKEDSKCHFPEALHFYEEGAGSLLNAVKKNRVSERQADYIRIKCLLIHDRCEIIRDHLERGAPIKIRKPFLDAFEHSLEGEGCSPEPQEEYDEEKVLSMEEVRSRAASMAGSTHSLYPTCVEIKRSESVMSGQSDFVLHSSPVIIEEEKKKQTLATLVDMDSELQLSILTIDEKPAKSVSSKASSRSSSLDNLLYGMQNRSPSTHSVNALSRNDSRLDHVLVFDENGKLSVSNESVEADRNVTELTFMNSEIEAATASPLYGNKPDLNDSGSDSGYSDPNPDGLVKSPSPSPHDHEVLIEYSERQLASTSPLSDVESIGVVPSLPQPSPELGETEGEETKPLLGVSSATPSPTPSSSASSSKVNTPKRRRSNRSGSSVKINPSVTVLSEETVTDSGKAVEVIPEVYSKAGSRPREEYIPPRSSARQPQEEDDDINKGCYYFMACLDSFWIL